MRKSSGPERVRGEFQGPVLQRPGTAPAEHVRHAGGYLLNSAQQAREDQAVQGALGLCRVGEVEGGQALNVGEADDRAGDGVQQRHISIGGPVGGLGDGSGHQ